MTTTAGHMIAGKCRECFSSCTAAEWRLFGGDSFAINFQHTDSVCIFASFLSRVFQLLIQHSRGGIGNFQGLSEDQRYALEQLRVLLEEEPLPCRNGDLGQ